MKMKYVKMKIMISLLVVFVLILGCGVLIYQKADQIRTEYFNEIMPMASGENTSMMSVSPDNIIMTEQPENESELIRQTYIAYRDALSRYDDNVGGYSMLKDSKGNTLAEEQNYLIVRKWNDENDNRIMLLGDEFFSEEASVSMSRKENSNDEDADVTDADVTDEDASSIEGGKISLAIENFYKVEITGTCDDTFIYLEKLTWTNATGDETFTYIPKENNTKKGTQTFEEWAGDNTFDMDRGNENQYLPQANVTCFPYGDWEKDRQRDNEAKKICEQVYADYVSGVNSTDYQKKESLLTCYVSRIIQLSCNTSAQSVEQYVMPYVYVFHPISIAVAELQGVLLGILLAGIIVILLICGMIQNVYKQQLIFEMNRRELTRGIAHELKTPLAITKGYVENWEYVAEKDRYEYSKTMIDEIEHMNKMVMDLLELSRLEAKAKEMNPESVELYALTKSVLKRMKEAIEERGLVVTLLPKWADKSIEDAGKNIEDADKSIENAGDTTHMKNVTNNYEKPEFLVTADLEMIHTVLVNFVSNAVKYAEKEINITLSESGKRIRFEIANDSKTLESQDLEKVWDEFYKGKEAEKSRVGSSGLGLAITKNILILHGAKYGCKSRDGMIMFWFEMK